MGRRKVCLASASAVNQKKASLQRSLKTYEVDVNTVDEAGNTPLHTAVQSGHFAAAECLIGLEAGLTLINGGGETLLHHLIQLRYSQPETFDQQNSLANAYVKGGGTLDAQSEFSGTALHLAILENSTRWVQWLLEQDPSLLLIPSKGGICRGQTPLEMNATEDIRQLMNHSLEQLESGVAPASGGGSK